MPKQTRNRSRHFPLAALCLLLTACGELGTTTYICEYSYTFEDGTELGEYASERMSCSDYAASGSQIMMGVWEDCEAEGADRGATDVWCECGFDTSPLCVPRSIDD